MIKQHLFACLWIKKTKVIKTKVHNITYVVFLFTKLCKVKISYLQSWELESLREKSSPCSKAIAVATHDDFKSIFISLVQSQHQLSNLFFKKSQLMFQTIKSVKSKA